MIPNLNEEQQMILRSVKEFVENEVKPRAMEIDRTGEFPHDLWKRCAELGLTGSGIPEEYGGLGLGVLMEQLLMEEIAKESPVLALIVDAHLLAFRMISRAGTEEQKQRFIPKLASGEMIGSMASTEAPGSTNYTELPPMGTYDGEDLILNTTKVFITNSHVADLYVFSGMVDGQTIPCVVEKGAPGLITGQIENKLGMNGSMTGTVRCVDLRVPKENILGEAGALDKEFAAMYLNISAISLGIAEAVVEKTTKYVMNRTRFGKPLGGFQVVAHHIAKMTAQVELARSIMQRAAILHDEGTPDLRLNFICKAFTCEMAVQVADLCIQLHGAAGYTEDTGIARYLRDAKCNTIGEHPTDIHWDYLALQLGLPIDTTFPLFPRD